MTMETPMTHHVLRSVGSGRALAADAGEKSSGAEADKNGMLFHGKSWVFSNKNESC